MISVPFWIYFILTQFWCMILIITGEPWVLLFVSIFLVAQIAEAYLLLKE